MLAVPEGLILARGTADPLAGSRRQQEFGTPRFGRPTGDWELIQGELVTFTDPQRALPPIDRLEGLRYASCSAPFGLACGHPWSSSPARRAQHVPAGDGGGVEWAHLDPGLGLLDAIPALRGESRQRPVVTPVSRHLRPYPDESV